MSKIPDNEKMVRKNWWKFKCDSCDYKTVSEHLYKSHMRSDEHKAFAKVMLNYDKSAPGHGEVQPTSTKSEPGISDKEFTCDECPYSTTWKTEYMWHKESHNKKLKVDLIASAEKKIKVELSKKGNLDDSKANLHEELGQHATNKLQSSENRGNEESQDNVGERKWYKCSKCEHSLSNKNSLKWHMDAAHTDIKLFKCDFCKHTTNRKDSLRRHVSRIHLEERATRIQDSSSIKRENVECGSEMQTVPSRSKKLGFKVSASKNFNCWECNYKTSCKSTFKEHMMIHKGYQSKCGALELQQDYSDQDISTDTAPVQSTWKRQGLNLVDVFLCQHCNYRSVSEDNIISHNRAIHGLIIEDKNFEEERMNTSGPKAEIVSLQEAPNHIKLSDMKDADFPLPHHQSETMDEYARKDPLLITKEDHLVPPKAPEKPLSAYMRFSKECWKSLRKEHPDLKLWEIGNIIGGKWRGLKAEEKKKYQDAWKQDKVRNSSK